MEHSPQTDLLEVRPTGVRWVVFALACITSFLLYLHRYTWGFIKADVQKEFGWSLKELGYLDSMFSVSYALGQIPFGILCDWFGPHLLLSGLIVSWSISMGAVALAGSLASMAACRFVFGLTQAGCYPVLSKVTHVWFPISSRTTVQGWVATFFGRSGGAISFFLLGSILLGYFQFPWRLALGLLTIVGIVFAIVFALLFRNSPAEHPMVNEAEAELIREGNIDLTPAKRSKLDWSNAMRSGNLWIFLVQQFTSAYADNVYVYWIPMYLLTQKGVATSGAGWMAALPLLGGAVGGMLGGTLQNWLIVRTGNRRWSRSSIGCIGKLAATLLMFVALSFESALTIILMFALVKFFSDWSQPTVWGTVTDIAGRSSASVFGIVNTVGSLATFTAGPTMGLIIMHFATTSEVRSPSVLPQRSAQGTAVTVFTLEHKPVEPEGLRGEFFSGQDSVGTFQYQQGELVFSANDNANGQAVVTLNEKLGLVSVLNLPDTVDRLDITYTYTDFGAGWTALFIALGLIYLVSSLSWLFIDCTKQLD